MTKEKVKFFFRQQLLLLAALYVMTFGVSLFIRSNLGSSAISVTPLVWSSAGLSDITVGSFHVPAMTVGGYTIIMNFIFVFLQILILRRRYQPIQLFQLVIGTLFSVFLDANMALTEPLSAGPGAAGVAWGLFLVAVAGVVMGVGVACEVRCRSVMMPGEGIQVAIAQVTGKEFSKVKIVVDTTLVCIGLASCVVFYGAWRWDIVGLGTLISMVYIGIMFAFFLPISAGLTVFWLFRRRLWQMPSRLPLHQALAHLSLLFRVSMAVVEVRLDEMWLRGLVWLSMTMPSLRRPRAICMLSLRR